MERYIIKTNLNIECTECRECREMEQEAGNDDASSKITAAIDQAGKHGTYAEKGKKIPLYIPPHKECNSAPVTPTGKNLMILDLTWDEVMGKSKKRKAMEPARDEDASPRTGVERLAAKARTTIKDIDKATRELCQLIRENVNTKREVKEVAVRLRSMTSQLMGVEMQELFQNLGRPTTGHGKGKQDEHGKILESAEKEIQTETEQVELRTLKPKQTGDMSTQTWSESLVELEKQIEGGEDLLGFQEIALKHWPGEAFKRVTHKQKNPLVAPSDTDVAIIITERAEKDKGLLKQVRDRFPEVEEALTETEGTKIVSVSSKTSTKVGLLIKETEKTLFLIDGGQENGEDLNPENIFGSLMELRHRLIGDGRKKVALAWDAGVESYTLKKLAEYIFRRTDIEVAWCTPARRINAKTPMTAETGKGDRTQESDAKRQKAGREKEEVLIVRTEQGGTYADLLRKVWGAVDPENFGAEISNIRKTRAGDHRSKKRSDGRRSCKIKARIGT